MSAYKPRGGALGWGGDEQQAVPRTPRHNRHHSTSHPGHQRMVRYDQGRHREDRRQVGTQYTLHWDILSSYIHIHPTTFNFKLQQAGSWSGRRSSWREFDVFHGTGLRTGSDIKQKTIDFILGKDY